MPDQQTPDRRRPDPVARFRRYGFNEVATSAVDVGADRFRMLYEVRSVTLDAPRNVDAFLVHRHRKDRGPCAE